MAPVGGVVAGGASVVCMASMGAMVAATTAGATAGMAGMGVAAASPPHIPVLTHALRAVGLGTLTHIPNTVLHPLLIVLLLIASGAALWRARSARTILALVLALIIVAAAVGLYASVYITISDTGYGIALAALLLASVVSAWPGRRRGRLPTA